MLLHECEQGKPCMTQLLARMNVYAESGKIYWKDATKYHSRLNGKEAGCARKSASGKYYWYVTFDSKPIKRSQIILALATGRWPTECVDHINGDSLDDRACNLRHASIQQNAWNHKRRRKLSKLPMGVRQTKNGRFQARIAVHKQTKYLGVFPTHQAASAAYQAARKESFGDFS